MVPPVRSTEAVPFKGLWGDERGGDSASSQQTILLAWSLVTGGVDGIACEGREGSGYIAASRCARSPEPCEARVQWYRLSGR